MFNVEVSLSFVFFLLLMTSKTKGNNAAIGDFCEVDKNCLTRQMVCGPGQACDCLQGHYPSEDNRNCIATTSGICFETADCSSLPYSSCVNTNENEGVCTCEQGYAPSEDEKECLAEVGYQAFCKQTSQCTNILGDHASCVQDTVTGTGTGIVSRTGTDTGTGTGTCGCQINFHYSNEDGKCIADVSLQGSCQNKSQCVARDNNMSHLSCVDGKCVCIDGYQEFDGSCKANAHHFIISLGTLLLCWTLTFVVV